MSQISLGSRAFLLCFIAVFVAGTLTVGIGTGSAGESNVQTAVTVDGVTLPIDAQTESELIERGEEIADVVPGVETKTNAAILVDGDEQWIVFSDEPIPVGETTIQGVSVSSSLPESDQNVLFADSVETSTRGDPADLDQVIKNDDKYHGELVRITADYQQLAYNLEVADGQIVQQSTVAQFNGLTLEMFPPGQSGRWSASIGSPDHEPSEVVTDRLNGGQVPASDYQSTRMWMDTEAQVDVVVLANERGNPTLYVADVTPVAEQASLNSIQSGEHETGDVVTIETDVAEARISTKETLLKVVPCGEEAVSTPSGCVPAVSDAVVHIGALYEGTPTSRDDLLLYAGISNRAQTQLVEKENRRVRVTGEIVDAGEIYPPAAGERALMVYEIEYINHNDMVADEASTYRDTLAEEMQTQMATDSEEYEEQYAEDNGGSDDTTSGGGGSEAEGESQSGSQESIDSQGTEFAIEAVDIPESYGDKVAVTATVSNHGDERGEFEVFANFEGESGFARSDLDRVTLDPGEEQEIALSIQANTEDTLTVYVNDDRIGTVEHSSGFGTPDSLGMILRRAAGMLQGPTGMIVGLGLTVSGLVVAPLVALKSYRSDDYNADYRLVKGTAYGGAVLLTVGAHGVEWEGGLLFGSALIVGGIFYEVLRLTYRNL